MNLTTRMRIVRGGLGECQEKGPGGGTLLLALKWGMALKWGVSKGGGMKTIQKQSSISAVSSIGQEWLAVFTWAIVAALVFQSVATAEKRRPSAIEAPITRQLEMMLQVKDCNVYQAVLRRTETVLTQQTATVQDVLGSVKTSRSDFERCALANGFHDLSLDVQIFQAAQTCFDKYDAWVRQGLGLEIAQQDLQGTRRDMERLTAFVRYSCPGQKVAHSN
jgi:hypothetical protein